MEVLIMTEKKATAPKFSKEQFLNASKHTYNLDAMYVVLEDDKLYTKDEAMKLYTNFMNLYKKNEDTMGKLYES